MGRLDLGTDRLAAYEVLTYANSLTGQEEILNRLHAGHRSAYRLPSEDMGSYRRKTGEETGPE
jgi:hypothetical protein